MRLSFLECMKRLGIGIAAILLLALVLCQRKEEATAEKTRAASSKSSPMLREEAGSPSDSKPTKIRQRPEQPEKAKPLVAKPVKGRPGFVYHPADGRILDVRGIWAGTLVGSGEVFFQLPKMGYIITPEDSMKAGLPREGGVNALVCRPHYPEPRWDDGTPVMPGDASGSQEGS
jgi:hypothetical protein